MVQALAWPIHWRPGLSNAGWDWPACEDEQRMWAGFFLESKLGEGSRISVDIASRTAEFFSEFVECGGKRQGLFP